MYVLETVTGRTDTTNRDDALYTINKSISGETNYYHGGQSSDKSQCVEISLPGIKHNDSDGFSPQGSPQQRSPVPRRSPSPYSCGSVSSFREPGNISSQTVQGNWNNSEGNDRGKADFSRNSTHKRENSLLNRSFDNQDSTNSLFCTTEGTKNQEKVKIGDKHNPGFSMNTDRTSDNLSVGNSLHPHIPVIEDNERKQTSISPGSIKRGSNKCLLTEEAKKQATEEATAVQTIKNDSLVRISHFLIVNNEEKRVVDERTVTELMDIYKSLKCPIILPFPRQRSYYDQWARFPSNDVSTRIYPRSNTNLSIKCWTLLQAIQNEQIKTNSAPASSTGSSSSSNNSGKLVVPNPADVTCKSLDSIIEHYNQLTALPSPIFKARVKTPPPTPLKSMASKTFSDQSSSSRSSSGNNNERNRGNCSSRNKEDENVSHSNDNHSPVPLRKKSNSKTVKCKTNQINSINPIKSVNLEENECVQMCNKSENKSIDECKGMDNQEHQTAYQTQSLLTEASIPTAELFSSEDNLQPFAILRQDSFTSSGRQQSPRLIQNMNCPLEPFTNKGRESSVTITIHCDNESDGTRKHMPPSAKSVEKRNLNSLAREGTRNGYDINTSSVRFGLPHDIPNNKNDYNENSNSFPHGETKGHAYQNPHPNGMVGLARRSKTRLLLSQMSPKSDRREVTLVSSTLHSPHHLKQSLLINELPPSKDFDGKQYTREKTSKKSTRSKSSTTWKNTQKPPELPTRGYSMCERLEPSESPAGRMSLSPETCRPMTDRQSAISLANVHFLDLTDLKRMLRRTNTPMPRL